MMVSNNSEAHDDSQRNVDTRDATTNHDTNIENSNTGTTTGTHNGDYVRIQRIEYKQFGDNDDMHDGCLVSIVSDASLV
jgi:hypothetical protein